MNSRHVVRLGCTLLSIAFVASARPAGAGPSLGGSGFKPGSADIVKADFPDAGTRPAAPATCFAQFARVRDGSLRMLASDRSGRGDSHTGKAFIDRLNDDPLHSVSADDSIAVGTGRKMPDSSGDTFASTRANAMLLGGVQCVSGTSIDRLRPEMAGRPRSQRRRWIGLHLTPAPFSRGEGDGEAAM